MQIKDMNEHETHSAVVKLARGELERHELINCWFRPEFVRVLIDRFESAHEREVKQLKKQIGNEEKMRKTLVGIKRLIKSVSEVTNNDASAILMNIDLALAFSDETREVQ